MAFECTGEIRLVKGDHKGVPSFRLQQRWVCLKTAEVKWRWVPVVETDNLVP